MAHRNINDLIEPFRGGVRELLRQAKEAGIPVLVTDARRTVEEQRELVRKGFSKTMNSKHLTGEAVDIAFLVDSKLSYDAKLYDKLYTLAKDIPYVIWPYKDLGWNWDMPHHQYDPTKHGIIEDMECKDLLGKQKELLDQEIGRVTQQRDDALDALKDEIKGHKETLERSEIHYEKWQRSINKKNALKKKLKECTANKFASLNILEKIRILLK